MMGNCTGWVVRATAGRDGGGLFVVTGMAGCDLLLADGKRRRLAKPKRKKLLHVHPMDGIGPDCPVVEKLKQGEPVSDRELRRALAAIKEGITLG